MPRKDHERETTMPCLTLGGSGDEWHGKETCYPAATSSHADSGALNRIPLSTARLVSALRLLHLPAFHFAASHLRCSASFVNAWRFSLLYLGATNRLEGLRSPDIFQRTERERERALPFRRIPLPRFPSRKAAFWSPTCCSPERRANLRRLLFWPKPHVIKILAAADAIDDNF